ncbi:MAG: hypothetical protein M1286_00080 [Candidatus Marsarchaeota archaeon]|nr:hypothetical protein [Candidatus Marsarchaeota archaeon]
MKEYGVLHQIIVLARRYAKVVWILLLLFSGKAYASYFSLDVVATLTGIQNLLAHLGPVLSAVLFIVAGIFYAIGQLFPATKRASLHATAIDILIGAVIVAVLSVASNGLALASTHLLSNITNASV